MKKILVALLLVSTVIGMTVPAMANPQNEPIAVAKNVKDITVVVDGSNDAGGDIAQAIDNAGNQNNWAQGVAIGGNAQSAAGNIGAAVSGAAAVDGPSSKHVAESFDNTASNTQTAEADASAGDPRGFGDDVNQDNTLDQNAEASIGFGYWDGWWNESGGLDLDQTVTLLEDTQNAVADAPGTQNITDSVLQEDKWTKNVTKYIN